MNYAFLIMGKNYTSEDRASIGGGKGQIVGVANLEVACQAAVELVEEGVGCIELCGAFGPKGAAKVIEATGNKIPVGYITHLPEQDELYKQIFSKK